MQQNKRYLIWRKYMMNWKIFSLLFLINPIIGYSQIQDTLHLTVSQLFDRGMSCNLKIQADKLRERITQEQKKSSKSALYPDIELNLDGGMIGQPVVFEEGLSKPTFPQAPNWSQDYGISLTQPLYQGGKLRLNIKKSEIENQIAALATATDLSDLKLNLLQIYLELFCAYKQHGILSRNIFESKRRLKDIRKMKEEGIITNNDVLRSELQLIDDSLSLSETINQIHLSSQQLDVLLNMDDSYIIKPDSVILFMDIPSLSSYDDYISRAYESNPHMQSLYKEVELSKNNLKIMQAEYLPKVSLVAGNALQRPISRTLEDKFNNKWNIGISLSLPLSSLYKNNNKVKEAEYEVLLKLNEKDQQKQRIRVQMKTAYLKYKEAVNKVKMKNLAIKQSQENYRIMQNRYMNQLVILTDLLDANSIYLNSQLQYITARAQAIYAYYELQNICGNL